MFLDCDWSISVQLIRNDSAKCVMTVQKSVNHNTTHYLNFIFLIGYYCAMNSYQKDGVPPKIVPKITSLPSQKYLLYFGKHLNVANNDDFSRLCLQFKIL